jgi:HAMP domain-containing protein
MNLPPASSTSSNSPPINKKKLRLNYFSLAFQLRYGVWLATIGVFCFFLMGFLIHLSIRHAIQDSLTLGPAKEALTAFLSPSSLFLGYDVLLPACILTVFLVAIGIVGTHRIAGPLFALKRHMNRVRLGKVRTHLKLRRGDELLDVAGSFNALLQESWNFEKEVTLALMDAQQQLDAGNSRAASETLIRLRAKLETRQNPAPFEGPSMRLISSPPAKKAA